MSPRQEWEPEGPPPTFSFYVTAHNAERNPDIVTAADGICGAVTLAGHRGPGVARKLRSADIGPDFLFDRCGYETADQSSPEVWAKAQREADAVEVLLPGAFVAWDKDSSLDAERIIREQARIATDLDAALLLGVDARWVGRKREFLRDELLRTERPVCMVLANRADPLAIPGAAAGLRWIASRVPELTLVRTDHGAVGALAHGAVHASFGLTTATRHFAPPGSRPRRRPGTSHRVFVLDLLGWFLASDIASWVTAQSEFYCGLPCCKASLARFHDPDENPDPHNMHALSELATDICDAPYVQRGRIFRERCEAAVQRYGLAGFHGPENPSAQLAEWALS